jgi:hypothetical protein
MGHHLTCLLCGHHDSNLNRMQSHVISFHERTSDDIRLQTKQEREDGAGYIYKFLDGTTWLETLKTGNYLGGL